jgi:hypothetical protein
MREIAIKLAVTGFRLPKRNISIVAVSVDFV